MRSAPGGFDCIVAPISGAHEAVREDSEVQTVGRGDEKGGRGLTRMGREWKGVGEGRMREWSSVANGHSTRGIADEGE